MVTYSKREGLGDLPSHVEESGNQRLIQQPGQFGKLTKAVPVSVGGAPALSPAKEAEVAEAAKTIARAMSIEAPFVRRLNYLDPPPDADPIDAYTDLDVLLLAPSTNVVILRIILPSGSIGIINRIANDLDTPAAYPQVTWNFRFKDRLMVISSKWQWNNPLAEAISYKGWHRRLGLLDNPTRMEMPLIFRDGGILELIASNADVVAHRAQARLMGWQYIPGFKSSFKGVSPEFQV